MVNDAIKPPLVAIYRGYKQVNRRKRRFDRWRAARPFWGGVLLILAGFIAGYTPFQVLTDWLFRPGTAQIISVMGSFFAIAVILSGIGALMNPEISNVVGMIGITFTILTTLVGNFGGLLIGTFLGIIGGALCLAWRRLDVQPAGGTAGGTGAGGAGGRERTGAGRAATGGEDGPSAAERAAEEAQRENDEG